MVAQSKFTNLLNNVSLKNTNLIALQMLKNATSLDNFEINRGTNHRRGKIQVFPLGYSWQSRFGKSMR